MAVSSQEPTANDRPSSFSRLFASVHTAATDAARDSQQRALLDRVAQFMKPRVDVVDGLPRPERENVIDEVYPMVAHMFEVLRDRDYEEAESASEAIRAYLVSTLGSFSEDTAADREPLTLNQLNRRLEKLEPVAAKVAELDPLVRRDAGETAAVQLEKAHVAQAENHRKSWKAALVRVYLAVAGTAVLAVGIYLLRPGDKASTADAISGGALSFLLLALALYLVRLFAQTYRSQRHLEIVNTQKADALRTFNEMIGMQREPEVQAVIATALASYIFASESSGLLGESADHITLVERGVAALTPQNFRAP